jgi:hypothetical protein
MLTGSVGLIIKEWFFVVASCVGHGPWNALGNYVTGIEHQIWSKTPETSRHGHQRDSTRGAIQIIPNVAVTNWEILLTTSATFPCASVWKLDLVLAQRQPAVVAHESPAV